MRKEREGVVYGMMTNEEKAELKAGKVQFLNHQGVWTATDHPEWRLNSAYRPHVPENTIWMSKDGDELMFNGERFYAHEEPMEGILRCTTCALNPRHKGSRCELINRVRQCCNHKFNRVVWKREPKPDLEIVSEDECIYKGVRYYAVDDPGWDNCTRCKGCGLVCTSACKTGNGLKCGGKAVGSADNRIDGRLIIWTASKPVHRWQNLIDAIRAGKHRERPGGIHFGKSTSELRLLQVFLMENGLKWGNWDDQIEEYPTEMFIDVDGGIMHNPVPEKEYFMYDTDHCCFVETVHKWQNLIDWLRKTKHDVRFGKTCNQLIELQEFLTEHGYKRYGYKHDTSTPLLFTNDFELLVASEGYMMYNPSSMRDFAVYDTDRCEFVTQKPWTLEDVPPVCWVREKIEHTIVHLITGVLSKTVMFGNMQVSYATLAEEYEYCDKGGQWKPCAKEAGNG